MGIELLPRRYTEEEILIRNRELEINKLLDDDPIEKEESLFEKILNYLNN